MSSGRGGLIGLGVGLGVAGAATAAGVVAGRVRRRRSDALETGVSLVEKPSRELQVAATDGVLLHVEVDEPQSGDGVDENGLPRPTVVMSHGYCLTSRTWVFQRRYLRWAGYRVVVWDQRGHGRSGRGEASSYTMAQLGEDLTAVIAATAPDGPLALVGHSMGGMTTMALGTLHPELVRDRVVAFGAVSTSAGGIPLAAGDFAATAGRILLERLGPQVAGLFETRPELLQRILRANSELADFLVERYAFASPVPRSVVRLVRSMILGTNLTVMSNYTPAFDAYDQTAGLGAFQGCETLVFNGEQDILTPPEHSEAIVRALPGAQHIIVRDAGHVIMLEHPDLLNQQLQAMVDRASTHAAQDVPAGVVPRVRRVVTDVDKQRRIERGLQRRDRSAPAELRDGALRSRPPGAPAQGLVTLPLPAVVSLPTAEATADFGMRLGRLLRPGDLVVLTGDLGAGKTTFTQGLGRGLGVRGPVTSPTFVIARVHPSLLGGPPLVHVDAYRLGGALELDDLDLDADVAESVTVVEWGHGVAERLADAYLEVALTVGAAEERTARLTGVGARWAGLVG